MGKIQVLSEQIANQIAAGEVVERPASVVKELVENAIDAGATRISVYLEEGGISLIRVSDNGSGMEPDDAKLAFERHATSKIRRERDLFQIRTLGFRGEALPSIASVSRVVLTTSHDDSGAGVSVRIDGGEFKGMEETARTRGTDVTVKDLFYNTPARLKFLKTVSTEVSHCADVVGRLALAHPQISFTLEHQGRELFRTPGDGKLLHVIHALYGKQVAGRMVSFSGSNLDFSISGYVTKPEITRSSRSYISLILNGRYVRSIPITQVIVKAFGTLLPSGRYPIGVIHIQTDPKLVDVNVHPSKLEVRLSKENELCALIEEQIRQALGKERLVPKAEAPRREPVQTVQSSIFSMPQTKPSAEMNPPAEPVRSVRAEQIKEEKPSWETERTKPAWEPKPEEEPVSYERMETKQEVSEPVTEQTSEPKQQLPRMEPLCQIHGTYIVAQSEDGFYLIDQHAAHERIYYEQFLEYLSRENQEQQRLLIPLTLECTPAEAEVLETHLPQLASWGVEIEPFGGTTFLVRSYPRWFPAENEHGLLFEIIQLLKEQGKVENRILRDQTAKLMACKAAIKANRYLKKEEMEALITQLNQCEIPYTCPHGRPIFVHFSTYELEKMFKRVM